jgi:hypothetical protein
MRHIAEADTADAEFSQIGSRAPAKLTAVMLAHSEFRLAQGFVNAC